MSTEPFDSWAVVEMMGHRRTAGRLTEVELFGGKMGRLDIPDGEGFTTMFFNASSVYCITPTTEELARGVAARNKPEPVHLYELPRPVARGDEEKPDRDDDPDEIVDMGYDREHRSRYE